VREGRVGIGGREGWEGKEWDEEREGLRGKGKVKEGWEGKKERGKGKEEGKGREGEADGPSHFFIQVYAYAPSMC
jgi:hypothetical protein